MHWGTRRTLAEMGKVPGTPQGFQQTSAGSLMSDRMLCESNASLSTQSSKRRDIYNVTHASVSHTRKQKLAGIARRREPYAERPRVCNEISRLNSKLRFVEPVRRHRTELYARRNQLELYVRRIPGP